MAQTSLDRLRMTGLRLLLLCSWLWTGALWIIGLTLGSSMMTPALLLSVVANLLPSIMVARGRADGQTRLMLGTLAMVQPAVGVYFMNGHPWQMDGHMYFFVALAALTVLYDWRPIVLASVLIALHHLGLDYVVPAWVFEGTGNVGRVAIHAVAVVLQASILSYLAIRIHHLLLAQDDNMAQAGTLAREAQQGREAAEAAMTASRHAEAREAALRDERERDRSANAQQRRFEMMALVDAFRRSVADIVQSVGSATVELEEGTRQLNALARRASEESHQSVSAATLSSRGADQLAERIETLSRSITAIAATAHQQVELGHGAQQMSGAGHQAVTDLADRTGSIAGFADSIHQIAARTNLLALNASIEAARTGEVGLGFAVVAGEVKQLAGQASSATGEIHSLAWSAQQGATLVNDTLTSISAMIEELAEAASAIQSAVDDQREAAVAIEETARSAASGATMMADKMVSVAGVARDTERLSERVSGAAVDLSQTARALQRAAALFVDQLEAA